MTNEIKIKEPELLVNDAHGIYIPKSFCQAYLPYIVNKDDLMEDIKECSNPDNEFYWESWENLINNVILTNDKGEIYSIGNLGEGGDLWAIPEGYEYPEEY